MVYEYLGRRIICKSVGKSVKVQEIKEIVQQMKTVMVKIRQNGISYIPNEDLISHKYSKHHDNIYVVIKRNNGSVADVHVYPFDPFRYISM